MKRRKEIIYYFIFIICFIFLVVLTVGGLLKQRSFRNNISFTKGIIIDSLYTIRYSKYFKYVFIVDNQEYQGSGHLYPAIDTISVGDTIIVGYDRAKPDNNKPLRELNSGLRRQHL